MYLVAVTAYENSDNQRSTSQTQFDGNRHAWNGKGERTEDESDNDAYENRSNVRCIQAAHGVAHLVGNAVHGVLRPHNHDSVTNLQRQTGRSEEIHAMTGDARDINAVHTREVHGSQ